MPRPGTGEWLLANGLGGYALGPRSGPATRGYHGWLVAAVRPPDGRVLLVAGIEAGIVGPSGLAGLEPIQLATGTAGADGIAVTLRAAMAHLANATVLEYRRSAPAPEGEGGTTEPEGVVTLRLTPLLAGRGHHPSGGPSAAPVSVVIEPDGRSARIRWADPAIPVLRLAVDRGVITPATREVPVYYPEEAARGTPADEILHAAVAIDAELGPGQTLGLVIGTEAGSRAPLPAPADVAAVIANAANRAAALVERARPVDAATPGDAALAALVLAADRFLVRRPDSGAMDPDEGITVIAGYPWFGDWGRDTMISLPGLTLATARHGDGERILRTWAGLVRDGLLPNHFPEADGGEPAYHAIDAPLWFVHALGAYEDASGDRALARDLRPAVEDIISWYRDGTRFGIGMDPEDALVRGGEPGLQLTWMDARVDGVVITPRHGKPVEIQALWIEALRLAQGWAADAGDEPTAITHRDLADRAAASFRARFFADGPGWLHDVVDGPEGDDSSLRPNQLLALSLLPDLVDTRRAGRILDAIGTHLVVPGGVRTLAPFEPGYRPAFQGPPGVRDAAYHQGPAWTWLLGPWITAVERWRGPEAARAELRRALDALDPDATGAIAELLEPEPPHDARGCPWQAWGVAELLRCAVALAT